MPTRKTARQSYKAAGQKAVKAGLITQQQLASAMASAQNYTDEQLREEVTKIQAAVKQSKKSAGGQRKTMTAQQKKKAAAQKRKAASQKKKATTASRKAAAAQKRKAASQKKKKLAEQRKASKAASRKARSQKRATQREAARLKKAERRAQVVTKPLRSRAGKLMRAIKSGKIAAKQGKSSPQDFTSIEGNRSKYEAFVKLYEGVVVGRKSRKSTKPKRVSVKARFQSIKGQKYPYQLKKGYRIPYKVVGGGGKGAGIIKTIPGSKATPFSKLSDAEQAQVVAFLNSEEGKMLRSKGAPKVVSLQKIKAQAAAQMQRRKSVKSRKSAKSRKQK